VTTFVALGDSTTAGFGDPHPDGRGWRGWAALLAEGLGPDVSYHNLAVSGACTVDLARDQLPAALALRPDLATVLVGVNDTLRGEFDVAGIGAALDHAIGSLRAAGAVVLTGCLPDPGRMFRLPAALARPLGRRVVALNVLAHRVATRHGTVHLHIPEQPGVYDPRVWSIDRLHPGERGHRLLARAYHDLLGATGFPVGHKPGAEPTSPPPSTRAQLSWMLTKGTQWLYARSTDLVPFLVRMAAAEWWYRVRGSAHRLDAHVQRELTTALALLDSFDDSVAGAARPAG
jgi:lysophospholipase L1-like esterase